MIRRRKTCRVSGSTLETLFTLGDIYVSDFIVPDSKPRLSKVPLEVCLSHKSGLIQLRHTADFDEMYKEYWYRSGTNATMTNELKSIVEKITTLMPIQKDDIWVDIGCNDGTLFKFVDKTINRIGYDPNNFVEESKPWATKIIQDYFTSETYTESKKAKYITSIAMFYDLENPHKFVSDIYQVLDDEGLWVIQMSYLPLMLQQLAFDNICHEHLEYYSLRTLSRLLEGHGFQIVDCELNDINGGSFRVYIRKLCADSTKFATSPYRHVAYMRIQSILDYENSLNLENAQTYKNWYEKIDKLRNQTVEFIRQEKIKGKKICGYGASTKGNTLLQWFGLDHTLIDAIAERQPSKFGLVTAGTNIPIKSEEEVRQMNPDYMLVLPWHFISEFREREKEYLNKGGKFIVPCPRFEIIGA